MEQKEFGIITIAIGVLILIVFNVIPIEDMIIDGLESSSSDTQDSPWKNTENGRSLWNSIKGFSNISSVLVIIVGFYQLLKALR
jgi:hypothetical protein